MISKIFGKTRVMGLVLAATVVCAPAAMAADPANSTAKTVSEVDVPVVVSSKITGQAMGLGSVEVLGVNVRENPTKDAAVLAVISSSDDVLVLSKEGDWYRVSCNGVTGFVSGDYLTVTSSGEAAFGYGLVMSGGANLRTDPDENSQALATVGADQVVTILGIADGWYRVELEDGSAGYVRSDLVDPTAPIPAEKIFQYAVVDCAAANLRSEPSDDAAKTDVLFDGSLCTLVAQVGDWYQVEYGDVSGYIYAPLMNTTNDESEGSTQVETLSAITARQEQEAAEAAAAEAAAAEAAAAEEAARQAAEEAQQQSYYEESYEEPSTDSYEAPAEEPAQEESDYEEPSYNASVGEQIVSVAKQYLGVPYVYGGTSPYGFDCSGLVQYVYRQCGYSISRTAQPQYSDGYYVSFSDLQPGDLVFFSATDGSSYSSSIDGISHVGIYIGGGDFIHAGGSQVKITSLYDSWYSPRYWGACRIV